MKFERRVVDPVKGIVQITTTDERWYSQEIDGKIRYLPSTTWVCSYYPKGINYMRWLAAHGWDEAEALKEEAGEKGSFTHKAVEMLLQGKTITFGTPVEATGITRELTADEYLNTMSFVEWYRGMKPKTIKSEYTLYCDTHAGTVDYICEIENELWIIDFKTSADVWPSHEIQLTAYREAFGGEARLGILQLGYKRNKTKKFKFTEVQYQPELWQATYKIWQKECAGIHPLQRDYPTELKLQEDK